jgi:hypothetical protein
MEALVDIVSGCMEAHSVTGPLGFRWSEEEQFWEVIVYPTPIELVGGAADGELVSPGFSLNVKELQSSFDEVTDVNWRAHDFGPQDPDGPHISIEGVYQGHDVYLTVLSEAPDDEEPGLKIDTADKAE